MNKNKIVAIILLLHFVIVSNAQNKIDPDGFNIFKYENGIVSSEGWMQNGKPNKYWKNYYENGKIKSQGNRKEYELDSLWMFYGVDGKKSSEINYEKGKKNGISLTFTDGVLSEMEYFENNIKTNESFKYYQDGNIHLKYNFKLGKEDGEAFEYDGKDGRIITLLLYKDGFLKKQETINRIDKQSNKTGRWVDFFSNGKIRIESNYKEGLLNGIYKEFDIDGNLTILLKYKNGEIEKDALESNILDISNTYYQGGKIKSSGGTIKGLKEGMHREYDENGNVTSGIIYKNNSKTAEGLIDSTGTFQGIWKTYYDTGELRGEGKYKDSKRDDEWIYYHRNGKIEQKGKYKNGKPTGMWKWFFDDQKEHREENYRNGKEEGTSVEYDREGSIITSGEYIGGLKEGEWFYKVGDHTEKGSYKNGEKEGLWKYEYENGKTNFIGEYIGGQPSGKHKFFYKNGQLKAEGRFKDGLKDGDWVSYNDEGLLILTIKYEYGEEKKINGTKLSESINVKEKEIQPQ